MPGYTRIDCFRLLADLKQWNLSEAEVARRLSVPRSTLEGWKEGSEPRYSDGCRLVELHAEIGNIRETDKNPPHNLDS